MKTRLISSLLLAVVISPSGAEPVAAAASATELRAVVELRDGSRLIGVPVESVMPIALRYASPEVPLALIARCQVKHGPEELVIDLHNGDHFSGATRLEAFALETVLGRLAPKFTQIERIEISVRPVGALSMGEGDLEFGGVKWCAWRTCFERQGERLVSLPKVREGYNYGHGGNGRGAQLCTNIGSKDWIDYRIDVDYCMTGVVGDLNPHGLPIGFRGGGLMFHMVEGSESWNAAPGTSGYQLGLGPDGTWSLDAIVGSYCKTAGGFGNHSEIAHRILAKGEGLRLDAQKGNHFRIEVVGKRIAIWIDDKLLTEVRDDKMEEEVGGRKLNHGGVAIGWGFECMGWIENFKAERM